MIIRLRAAWAALTSAARGLLPHLPTAARLTCEVAGLLCAAVFLAELWPPLVWAAAAAILLLAGQRR